MNFNSFKNIYQKHQVKIDKYCTLAEKISSDVSDILAADKLTVWSWVKVGFKARTYLSEYLKSNEEDIFTNLDKFDAIKDNCVKEMLIDYCRNNKKIEEVKIGAGVTQSKTYDTCFVGDALVSWKPSYYGDFDFYIEKGKLENAIKDLHDFYWNETDNLIISKVPSPISKWKHLTIVNMGERVSDDNHEETILSKKLLEDVKVFKDLSFGRSVVYYGPPGPGKSTIVRNISSRLSNKCLRINNLNHFDSADLKKAIDLLNPEVILFEDIDHFFGKNSAEFLEKLETMNKQNKIVLATANEVKNLNEALLRPGRFDQLIEIKLPDAEVLEKITGGSSFKFYDEVKTMPLAFINEAVKRAEILGPEVSIEDLKKRAEKYNGDTYKL